MPGYEIVVVAGSSPVAEAERGADFNFAVAHSNFGAAEVARVLGSSLTVGMMPESVALATETAAGKVERTERAEKAAVPNSVGWRDCIGAAWISARASRALRSLRICRQM